MSSSTTWSDSNLLSRMDVRRRQRLYKQSRSGTPGYAPLAIAFVFGLVIGLPILGWWLWPVKLGNANPSDLAPAFREAYVAMVADSYALNGDLPLAQARLGALPAGEASGILKALEAAAIQAGSSVQAKRVHQMAADLSPSAVDAAAAEPRESGSATAPGPLSPLAKGARAALPIGLLVLAGLALVAGAFAVYRYARMPDLSGALALLRGMKLPAVRLPAVRRHAAATTREPETARAQVAATEAEPMEMELSLDQAFSILADEIETEDEPGTAPAVAATAPAVGVRLAVGNYMVTYRHGAAEPFDTSHSIETDNGEFLGECGVGVAETFGDSSPERVCALELWLFDKSDIRTTTKTLATEYALQDPDTRGAISSRGEAVRAQAGQSFALETASLTLRVDVVGLVYAESPDAPPKAYFQELIMELTATQK